jgi:putative CocE/NonD family hydrolase
MRLNIYYSGIRVAEWEDGRFSYEAGLYPVPGILKGMLPEDLSVILKEAQKAIDLGLSSFTLPGGQSYSKADEGLYIQHDVKYPIDIFTEGGKVRGFCQPALTAIIIGAEEGFEAKTPLAGWQELYGTGRYGLAAPEPFEVVTRDGIRLAGDLYIPSGAELPLPCVLIRTPYGKENCVDEILPFVLRGFAGVVQDTRGRHASEGVWEPCMHEICDGEDTLKAIAASPWCSGSIGMFGASYKGYAQWAAAASGEPHLKALVSLAAAGTPFVDASFPGGTASSGDVAWLSITGERYTDLKAIKRDDWKDILAHRPVSSILKDKLGLDMPFWSERLKHPCDDAYWAPSNWYKAAQKLGSTSVNALIQSGWFDDDANGTLQAIRLTDETGTGERRLLLGAWCHAGNSNHELGGLDVGTGALRYDLDLQYFKWFERHLKGRRDVDAGARAEYFTLGENAWKKCEKWPPEGSEEVVYMLGDGTLSKDAQPEGSLSFVYDPCHPAPQLINTSDNELQIPADYSQEEKRPDYITFTSGAFEAPAVFTGTARFILWVSGDAPSTDLVVRLTKVEPDNRSVKMGMSVLNMCLRDGLETHSYMQPGVIYKAELETANFSFLVKKGERIRVSITSSAEKYIFPNPNTEEGLLGTEVRIARNTVHFGGEHPSRVILSIENDAHQ